MFGESIILQPPKKGVRVGFTCGWPYAIDCSIVLKRSIYVANIQNRSRPSCKEHVRIFWSWKNVTSPIVLAFQGIPRPSPTNKETGQQVWFRSCVTLAFHLSENKCRLVSCVLSYTLCPNSSACVSAFNCRSSFTYLRDRYIPRNSIAALLCQKAICSMLRRNSRSDIVIIFWAMSFLLVCVDHVGAQRQRCALKLVRCLGTWVRFVLCCFQKKTN